MQQGLSMAIAAARGGSLSGIRHDAALDHQPQSFNNQASHSMEEFGTLATQWTTASLQARIPVPHLLKTDGLMQPILIHASVTVKGQSSHAADSSNTVSRLHSSKSLWGKPAALTRSLTSVIAVQAHLTDITWKRPKPKQDLLSDWKNIVP